MAHNVASEAQVGHKVDTTPAQTPGPESIEGTHVKLERLSLTHTDDLYQCIGSPGTETLWRYVPDGPFHSRDSWRLYLKQCTEDTSKSFYTILDRSTSRALGFFALFTSDLANRATEIGYVVFGHSLQRTRAATEAVYLLSRHAFERLGFRRNVWKCNDLNGPSKRAAVRYGFVYEGIFRQHLIVKGRNRDTAWYSMVDGEWPEVKKAFEAWLADANFDGQGRQMKSLADFRCST